MSDEYGMMRNNLDLLVMPVEHSPIQFLATAALTAAAAWRNKPIILDVSKYQTDVNWKAAKADGVVAGIVRAGQGDYEIDAMLSTHVQGIYDAGLPCGVYWVVDPYIYQAGGGIDTRHWPKGENDRTVKLMKRALKNKAFHFIALDYEMFLDSNGKPMTDVWVSTAYRFVYEQVGEAFPGVPVLVYTAKWVVDRYPILTYWLDNVKELWLAQYPIHPAQVQNLSSLAEWREKWSPPDTWKPTLFGNISGALLWQVSGDRFTVPYHRGPNGVSALDINLWNGTLESFYQFIKWQAAPEPEPPTPPTPETGDLAGISAKLDEILSRLEGLKWLERL